MDPFGFALESFDVTGALRERYRVVGPEVLLPNGKRDKSKPGFTLGPPVDASGQLADGRAFSDVRDLRRHLLANPDALARALAAKLIAFGTGHVVEFADREAVEAILAQTRARGHGARDLLHAVIASPMFLSK